MLLGRSSAASLLCTTGQTRRIWSYPEPDVMWQDCAGGYTANAILRWGDSSRDRPKDLVTYEAWLIRTERRDAYGSNSQQLSAGSALST